jgi:major type 1 subunit fimbrin (pilin)
MKKLIIAASIIASVSTAAFADDGKINFIGAITDDACTVVNDVSSPLKVTLGTVSSKAFQGAGSTAAAIDFTIALKNCPMSMTSAKVRFDGTADSNVNTLLALTQETGVATGVGIQLKDKNKLVVPMKTDSSSYALTVGDNNLDFEASYYATAATVTAGPANATSNFTIIYN